MSTRKLVVWIAFLGVFAMAARLSLDTDTWWHLRAGEWMVSHRTLLNTDMFSYTRQGEPWNYPGWLVEIPMYLIYQAFGAGGLNIWVAAMVTLTFAFVWRTLSGGPFLRAFVIILAATVSAVYWAARPYMVTFLFTAITLWILEGQRYALKMPDEQRNKPGLWWLPVLMIVWANSHGGFAVGFILWGVYWLADISRSIKEGMASRRPVLRLGLWRSPLTLAGIAMLAAVCITPSGPGMLLYPFKTVGIGVLQEYIQEWQSPDFHSLSLQPFIWMLLLVVAAVGISRRRLAFIDFALLAGFIYLALTAGRNIALFALVAPMVVTRHLEPVLVAGRRSLPGLRSDPAHPPQGFLRYLNVALLLIISLAVGTKVISVLPESANAEAFRQYLPVQAVEYLQITQPPGRLFNSYNWGSYLIWDLREYPVFVDGRTDLHDDEVLEQWLQVARAEPGWQAVLERWDVRLVLVERNLPIVRALASGGWQEAYRDEQAVIYRK